jgi:hypothetical protein
MTGKINLNSSDLCQGYISQFMSLQPSVTEPLKDPFSLDEPFPATGEPSLENSSVFLPIAGKALLTSKPNWPQSKQEIKNRVTYEYCQAAFSGSVDKIIQIIESNPISNFRIKPLTKALSGINDFKIYKMTLTLIKVSKEHYKQFRQNRLLESLPPAPASRKQPPRYNNNQHQHNR